MPSLAPEIFDLLRLVLWKISELDGTHTGAVVMYYGFDEQA